MTTSIFLARLIGPFALALGLALVCPGRGIPRLRRRIHGQPGADLPVRRHHAAGRPRHRADPQRLDRRLARRHHHRRLARGRHRRHPHARPATGRRQGAGRDRQPAHPAKSAPRSGSRSVRCSASSAIFADNRFHPELEDHEQTRHRPRPRSRPRSPPARWSARARSTPIPRPRRTCACRSARSCCRRAPASRTCRSTTPPASTPTTTP